MGKAIAFIFGVLATILVLVVLAFFTFNDRFGLMWRLMGPKYEVPQEHLDKLQELFPASSTFDRASDENGQLCVFRVNPGIVGDIDIFDEIPDSWLAKTLTDREINEPQPEEDYFLLLNRTPGYGDDEFWFYVSHFKASAPTIMLEEGWVRATNLRALTPECSLGGLVSEDVPVPTATRGPTATATVVVPVVIPGRGVTPCVYRAQPGIVGDIDIFDEIPESWLDKTLHDREIDEPQPDIDLFLLLDETPGYGDDEYWLHVHHFKASAPTIMLEEGWVRATNLRALTPECSLGGLVSEDVPVPTATSTVVVTPAQEDPPCVYRAQPGIVGDIDIFDEIPESWLDKTLHDREIDEPQPDIDLFLLLDETPGYGDDEYWLHVHHFKASAPTIMLEEGWVRATNLRALTPECSLDGLVSEDVPVPTATRSPTATATVVVPTATPVPTATAVIPMVTLEPEEWRCVYRAQPGILGDIDIFDEIPESWLDKTLHDREIDEPQPETDFFLLLDETPGYGDDEYWLHVHHFKALAPDIMLEKGWVRVTNLQALTTECTLEVLMQHR